MSSDTDPLAIGPHQPESELLKVVAVLNSGDVERAEQLCFGILENNPNFALAMSLLAEIYMRQGRVSDALKYSEQAVAAAPNDAAVLNNHAGLLNRSERSAEALEMADAALRLEPDLAEAHGNRASALVRLFRFAEARKALELALELKEELKPLISGIFVLLYGEEGQYKTARKLADAIANENPGVLEFALNRHRFTMYTPSLSRREERESTIALWNATPKSSDVVVRSTPRDYAPNRPLRIGYFSADFKKHPVSEFLKPVLQRHDPSHFQTILYDVTPEPDDVSQVIKGLADKYHRGVEQSDYELAQTISDDDVDLLVDLTGVFNDNRLNVFRYRPAPLQLMWIGYSGTSGLTEMDYVIADDYVCPRDADADFVEKIVRLPHHYLCHEIRDVPAFPFNPFAQVSAGITFGNFNNHMKLNTDVIRVWSEILKRVPNSNLYLKAAGFSNANIRTHVRRQFEARGIESQRLKITAHIVGDAHMNAYNEVDIALDPFPYCGTTTTVDALSMGVPVVTLVGERWVQRTSYGFLTGMGWGSLCATTEQEYMDIAIGLAQNPAQLRSMKAEGREKFLASPLCDPDRFTKELEAAYRTVWQQHCENV